jgi:CHAT domain-containing protein/tetratricopeptide (TPR) repeat protein
MRIYPGAIDMKASKTLVGLLCSFLLTCLLVTVCFAQKYRPDPNSARDAIVKGEAKEFLSAMEAQGQEAEKNGKWAVAASAYNEAAWAAQNSGQLQKAVSYAGKGLEFAEKTGDQELRVRAIYLLTQVHGYLRQYEKAREWTEKGIETTRRLTPGPFREGFEGHFYRMLGGDFLRRGDLQKAIEHLSYSVRVQDSRLSYFTSVKRLKSGVLHNGVHLVVISLAQLAEAYQRTGNMETAIKTYEKGIFLIKRFSARTQAESSLYLGLGQVYLTRKDFPRALENLKKALTLAESQQRPTAISSASLRIGDVFNQSGKPAEAVPYYQRAIQQVESTRTLLQSEEHRQSFFEGELGAYVKMMDALLSAGKAEDAFNYGERARSRTFLDILGSKVQLSRVQGGLLEEERALQERIAALKAKSAAGEEEGVGTERESLRRELAEAEKAYEAFLSRVRKQDKEQASLMSVEPLTLKEVQELLEPGVSMLEYFVTEQEVLLWIVEKDKAQFVRVPIGRGELVAKATSLRENIYNVGEKEKFKASSQELYDLLLKPALYHIRGKELLIVPHDVLHYVPFQALLSPAGKYLIQDYPVYYLSSASLMQFTRAKRRASGESALVMGNPSLGDEAYNLRFAEREAKEVATIYPQSAVYVLADASKIRAVSLSPKYDILHFAVHAELDEDDPLSSALLLAGDGQDDGRLNVGEIFSLGLKAAMVVLSACDTGLGKLSNGDEMIGLTRAFIYAGSPSVVTTLWKVNDRAGYELIREFYRHLKTTNKSEALRRAQLKTMEQFPEPFYWAAYGLTGER